MDGEFRSGLATALKRHRDPLSDTEDNVHSSDVNDVQKRRRLEVLGEENVSPTKKSSTRDRLRCAELVKPDTPALCSVRSRVQQLTQRREGGHVLAQRCLSDPGSGVPSIKFPDGFKEHHLIGEAEFSSRVERFKSPTTPQASPLPANRWPRTLSNAVTNLQLKLEASDTPSSKQASRIRQEREEELRLVRAQPITENVFLKRSFSDSSLTERATPPVSSFSPWMMFRRSRRLQWPPFQPWNQADLNVTGDEPFGVKDGSFTETSVFTKVDGVEPPIQDTGEVAESSVHMDVPPEEVKGRPMAERQAECTMVICQGTSLPDEHEAADGPVVKEQKKAVSPASDKHVERDLVKFYVNAESHLFLDNPVAMESKGDETELSSRDETNTAEMIDLMFDEVLEAAAQGRMEEDTEDHNSGIATAMRGIEETDTELDKAEEGEDLEETKELDSSADELLSFPPSFILSPLSKSVEAVVTPMRLAANQLANPPSLLLTPEELTTPPADSAPLYSIDAYRTQRQSTKPAIQSVTPRVQRHAAEKSHPQHCVNTKERIMVLNEDAAKLQMVIKQTLQALSCCTDEDHGRGSLEEAEADKLLLVSCEKRAALLAEVARLKERGGSVSEDLEGGDGEGDSGMSQQPCRGTVSISSVQLPLKVEFVCSARTQTGRPTHYFFVLIRYGPCNIVATPLATAVDAQNGDTISFPTSITLQDIRSNFEIDVEVYSLSHTSGNTCNVDLRSSTKSRVTPRKLLSTIKRSNQNVTSSTMPPLNTQRTSNFSLVGSHKISLASLGQSKFPLDKMKFEGKIRRLLGDEFQEKVPFLSPLEGNIYLQLDSESHSNVQHQGFLTMFEVVNGFGAWHRRFFVLEGNHMSYWNHPNDRGSKAAEGSISLSSSSSQSVKPVMRDSCARPYTFELVSSVQTAQQDDQGALAKCWFSADTGEDRGDWMENLNQVLLDLHTWTRCTPEPC
ncbi:anillin, actin binding protein 2 isoform X7 [Oncorhynchus kisutch]|uniref:anillin, actin binding protein 2 isoform X7 n=1 Tax=Oncorhynchus kisutch TaxID=8019 RepID=UPI0012DED418|nr:anillin isoform X7 [Oncorhynchus kisutch]